MVYAKDNLRENGKEYPIPQDSFNGLVVAGSERKPTKWRQVARAVNTSRDDTGHRQLTHLIAPSAEEPEKGSGVNGTKLSRMFLAQ
jgi:hypothetical protein